MPDVDEVRSELKRLGYLSAGIERWFELDPMSSRAFWAELLLLAAKSAALLCVFVASPYVAVMLLRNRPLGLPEALLLVLIYLACSFLLVFGAVMLAALLFKLRPLLAVESPRTLTAISIVLAAAVSSLTVLWWLGFGELPELPELFVGSALMLLAFALTARVFFAALLAFSIHESRALPTAQRRSAAVPMTIGAVFVLAMLLIPAYLSGHRKVSAPPLQVAVRPTSARIALLGVDGLTHEIFSTRGDLKSLLPASEAVDPLPHKSSPEMWATIGTGTPPALHGVRSVEGIRLLGGRGVLQSVSAADAALRDVAPLLGVSSREPLPPTARERPYVWEVAGERGVRALAANWWTARSTATGALVSIPQSAIFTRGGSLPPEDTALVIDRAVSEQLGGDRQIIAGYYPALDIVLNRLQLDSTSRLTASVAALENLSRTVARLRRGGFDVIVVGVPGVGQNGRAVVASTLPAPPGSVSLLDVAPTILNLLGFPASEEMGGRIIAGGAPLARISSYGTTGEEGAAPEINREYYESLRALGYIR